MKKDICDIVVEYDMAIDGKISFDIARENLHQSIEPIVNHVARRFGMTLHHANLYLPEDLYNEIFMRVDKWFIENEGRRNFHCIQVKKFLYQFIAYQLRNLNKHKIFVELPFNKQGKPVECSMVSIYDDDFSIKDFDEIDVNGLETEHVYKMIIEAIQDFTLEEKTIFMLRFIDKLSLEKIGKQMRIGKKRILDICNRLKSLVIERVNAKYNYSEMY